MIEEWTEAHPQWAQLVRFIENERQSDWVSFAADFHLSSHLLVATQEGRIVGFLRFVVQEIGSDEDRPSVTLKGTPLIEAKALAFGVDEKCRRRGVGKALQTELLKQAELRGCYQVRSHSGGSNEASHQLKLSMGFGVHPIVRGDDNRGVYFVMPLRTNVDPS